MRQFERDPTGN